MTAGLWPATAPTAVPGALPRPTEPPPPRARSTSLDTRQQPRIGQARGARNAPTDPLEGHLRDPRARQELKRDLVTLTAEIARRAELELEYAQYRWFSDRSAALEDCTKVVVVPDPACGGGHATPLSCRTRGCPDCERARMGRILDRFDKVVTGYTAKDATVIAPMARPVFWTWAVRNVGQGDLWDGLVRLRRDFGRLRRRSIVKGGPCRWRWADRGPTGELDGSPGHPCHPPIAAPDCRTRRCAPGCEARRRGDERHLAGCEPGCPTRTGRHQSHCRTHRPTIVHPSGCPRGCEHHGHAKGRNCPDFRHEPIAGGVSAIEVTFNTEALTWHPHVHALVDAPWISWAEMRDTWQAITCDRKPCRHGRDPECRGSWTVWVEAIDPTDEDQRHSAIREVLKYVAKPAGIVDSLDPDRLREFLWSTRGLRAVNGWGSLYRVKDPDDELEDDDTLTLRIGFMAYRVPKVCPCCGRPMTVDDWGWPRRHDRLEATRPDGASRWQWQPPPVAPAVPSPDPAPVAPVIPVASTGTAQVSWLEGVRA